MARPLGKHQLALLATMASPFSALVVGDPVARSLAERGYLSPLQEPWPERRATDDGAFFGITPAGLRHLADDLEAGKIDQFLDPKYRRDRVRLYMDTRAKKAKT